MNQKKTPGSRNGRNSAPQYDPSAQESQNWYNYPQGYGESYDPADYENAYGTDYSQQYDTGYNSGYGPQNVQNPYSGYADPQWDQQSYGNGPYQETPPEPPKKRKRSIIPWITELIFLLVLGLCSFLFYRYSLSNLETVKSDLVVFEQAQPNYRCQQIFDELFQNPDWGKLYDLAGIQDSPYEGKEAFVAYMSQTVDGGGLSYHQIRFDPAEPLVYEIRSGEETIGSFSMENHGTSPEVPKWELGQLKLQFTADQSFQIKTPQGCSVLVNGIALDESHMIRQDYVQSLGEKKIQLPGTQVLEVRGLLQTPQITVTDSAGAELQVSFDEAAGLFSVPTEDSAAISDEEREIALEAVKNYCKFMINKGGGRANLKKYFKADTDTYNAIVGSDLSWIQKEKDHGYANETVTDYIRYNDNSFSARVSLTWQLTRPDGSVKESQVEKSLVFERDSKNGWLCTRMTGLDLTESISQVRITFMNGDEVLTSCLLDAGSKTISCPKVTAPEGKVFSGWMTQKQAQDGSSYYQRVLIPEADGNAAVPDGILPLEPMILYPVFETPNS